MVIQFKIKFTSSIPGEGKGYPLHYSCLENPRDGGGLVGCCLWGRTESGTTEALGGRKIKPPSGTKRQPTGLFLEVSNMEGMS